MRLKNKVAIITGAGSGIGKAIAHRFAKEGAHVVIPDINLTAAQNTANELQQMNYQALAIQMDVTKKTQIEAMINETLMRFNHIDILVNNAGINLPAPFLDFPLEKWNKTIDINLTGVFLCSQAVAKQLVKQKLGGTIISIASIAAFNRYPGSIAYPVSKGGVVQLTRTMAAELAEHKITVNAIAPGTTLTDMTKKMLADQDAYEREVSMIPLKRFAQPEEIGGLAVYLASDDASYITGEVIVIDGGWLMR